MEERHKGCVNSIINGLKLCLPFSLFGFPLTLLLLLLLDFVEPLDERL
jgi:hypothetical protein